MPSRVHWYMRNSAGEMLFDHQAYYFLRDWTIAKIESMYFSPESRTTARNRCRSLPVSFRKGFESLATLHKDLGIRGIVIKKFRLPKGMKRSRNPIVNWRRMR